MSSKFFFRKVTVLIKELKLFNGSLVKHELVHNDQISYFPHITMHKYMVSDDHSENFKIYQRFICLRMIDVIYLFEENKLYT
jgi:hypothetical protein